MGDEKDNEEYFAKSYDHRNWFIKEKLFKLVDKLFQFENSKQPENPEKSGHFENSR